ncbi:hypothetical protein SIID45300_01851 [Candidatus Magnetaquicoccaceae bacterium FCR-1]|uniref:Secreted protein n=1 Tax=Candidatus Magnetaquiglobus chichijimensis TaxID=3141448 RepID=A0ABQ0C9G5_9PROT
MPHSLHTGPIVTGALLMLVGSLMSGSAHAEPKKPAHPHATPPAFDLSYQRDGDANPGQMRFSPTPDGQQIWIGTPRVIVHAPDGSNQPTSPAPGADSITIPANPPTLTFDLTPDGTLTPVRPDPKQN